MANKSPAVFPATGYRAALALLLLFIACLPGPAAAAPVTVNLPHENPIGHYADYLKENAGRLTLKAVVAAYRRGAFTPSRREVLAFGIGGRPVWIHFRVENTAAAPSRQRLTVETPWLDWLDIYIRRGGRTVATYHLSDRKPFRLRPIDSRYFALDHAFPPGLSDVFVRVQTPDPVVAPIYLMSPAQAQSRAAQANLGYGFLYGFLIALLVYNLLLYSGLREGRYALYSLYLGMFVLMNVAYTGHGFKWFWPEATGWEQWAPPVLMIAYAVSGLLFALSFLETRHRFPRMRRAVLAYIGAAVALLLLAIALGAQRDALLLAFSFVSLFTAVMVTMGVIALRGGMRTARYFLLACISAMVGAALTALAVWGFIPFNIWTFHAVDIGMLLDATLLALALTYQFRIGQAQKEHAEQLARRDPLTDVNNRRAFYNLSTPIWSAAIRHGRNLSVILLDLDHFKRVNDTYGHACGDEVLKAAAGTMRRCIRDHDLIARWGGEEFILLLPETDFEQALILAERLRNAIAQMRLTCHGQAITITASLGVAEREESHGTIEEFIADADRRLYQAKDAGRNKVSGY